MQNHQRNLMDVVSGRFCEFLEVCTHAILCTRNVYPKELFSRERRLGDLRWWCRSPRVCEYTDRVFSSLRDVMKQRLLSKVIIAIRRLGKEERFVFKFDASWREYHPDSTHIKDILRSLEENFHCALLAMETQVKARFPLDADNNGQPAAAAAAAGAGGGGGGGGGGGVAPAPNVSWEVRIETTEKIDVAMGEEGRKRLQKDIGFTRLEEEQSAVDRLQCNWVATEMVQSDLCQQAALQEAADDDTFFIRLIDTDRPLMRVYREEVTEHDGAAAANGSGVV
ncbi:unnamed protein product [Vitrella brassicaformis CCMP3155]|uniref:HORMA domain-containing protein n=1 Tax=Vitrella brassicaformis (strain CCMP3155) TaxID=1169540 RepID=A0A0G4FIE3_VITBC|nr:unnamed protein product [Vitrella brassicaformis CCMP3155]|eukprot:CEM12877.1 unnamed protein product [Vitrella brassicaformis CCMP3155]